MSFNYQKQMREVITTFLEEALRERELVLERQDVGTDLKEIFDDLLSCIEVMRSVNLTRWGIQELGPGQRRLTAESKRKFLEICQQQIADPANKETDGMMLYTWLTGLLENLHRYPEWFEETP